MRKRHSSKSFQRGVTFSEMLVVTVALALLLVVALASLFPVLWYLNTSQAKIDTQSNAVPVLYRLQREIRMSDARAIYYKPSPSAAATPLPTTPTSVSTFAVATAKTGNSGDPCNPGGPLATSPGTGLQTDAGGPNWQAFEVYNLSGNGTLSCVYEPFSPAQTSIPTATQANTAMTTAAGVINPPLFGNAVFNIQLAAEPGQNGLPSAVVDMKIQALATVNGRTNETTYTLNLLTRQ